MSISSTLVHRAEIRFQEAPHELRPFVGCFWVMTAERDATIRIVPDGSTAISIQLQNGEPAGWFLRGPLVRSHERRFTSPALLVGVRLRAGVAFILSRICAHQLVGRRISLRDVPAFHELGAARSSLQTPAHCIDVLERFLIQRLKAAKIHSAVATAIREIDHARGCVRVADVAARCGVSERHLNRLMRVWIGYGPKRHANIIRFQQTLHQMEGTPSWSAATLASETGYFDQAHLTLNLTRLAGATPGHLASTGVADFSKTRCDELP
jgi:AraC-like DNA-binding protein